MSDSPTPTPSPEPLAVRPAVAAKMLSISERLLWSKTNCGEIPCVRIGRSVLYSVETLKRWLNEQTGGGR